MTGTKLLMTFPVTPISHTLEAYRARGGYATLEKACATMQPEQVTKEVAASGILGHGGAAFPAGRKWGGDQAATTSSRTISAPMPTRASRAPSRTAGSSRTRRTC